MITHYGYGNYATATNKTYPTAKLPAATILHGDTAQNKTKQ